MNTSWKSQKAGGIQAERTRIQAGGARELEEHKQEELESWLLWGGLERHVPHIPVH
jgi:hypothetical protein